MHRPLVMLALALSMGASVAQPSGEAAAPRYDAALARSLGADERGMRRYVLVILKTGPTRVPAGPERDEMFKGHFANINRLSAEGVLAVADIDEARKHVATDPVIVKGEMVAEYHVHHGSAALMLVRDAHARIAQQRP
jgi:hypothetical protein